MLKKFISNKAYVTGEPACFKNGEWIQYNESKAFSKKGMLKNNFERDQVQSFEGVMNYCIKWLPARHLKICGNDIALQSFITKKDAPLEHPYNY